MPTAPASITSRAVRAASSGLGPYPASTSAVTGTCTAPAISAIAAIIRSAGIFCPSGSPCAKATPALVVARAGNPASSMMRELATSHTFASTSGFLPRCNALSASAFFFCSRFAIRWHWMRSARAGLHLFQEFGDVNHGASHRPSSNLLCVVTGRHTQGVETSVEGFEHSFSLNSRTDPARGAVLDVDRSSYRDLVVFAERLQRLKCRRLHQPDHVRRGIHRRQFGMM